ncbi:chymotrypsin-like elastase family member 2A [Sinocyclocheilus rhinocerous]|uniref:chymotrypsin-like elastase family member 2A n=1 Tax=Sinocyclocheilus rhinocerous TaxID=307959 RepID=UPI0007B86887|nr:PREDICTED: chymotrypsin-like elastase family member 2A [Sinocyclocheilus rhinocerous]
MFALILASVLIASAFGCGKPPIEPLSSRVVNGEEARPHSWPWQISLQYQSGSSWYHTCGGSIIAENWVMTAAHCISSGRNYMVHIGKHDLSVSEDGSKTISAQKIIVHEKWNSLFVALGLNLPSRQSLAEDLALCDRQYSDLALFSSTHLIHYYATLTHWQEPNAD